ncbi:uncharacterized protein TRAVEDRAFT_46348, partial [Trametes versicolor FP-101664 SS1]|uniref:uncharacterized protein n=1 Tax=Trametes versicolor (strain FP-101664) TaxID=717944 RepID=UPI0004622018
MTEHTSNHSSFAKLNDVNYPEWTMRMEAHLIRKKLWDGVMEITVETMGRGVDVVEEEYEKKKQKRSTQKMAEARAELVMSVDD